MKKKLKKLGNPVLRSRSRIVLKITSKVKETVNHMWDILNKCPTGVGLAAPQIGTDKRIIIVKDGDENICLINPVIVEADLEKEIELESCMSLPRVHLKVPRSKKIKVIGKNLGNNDVEIEAEGLLSRTLQHEIDHLDGILIIDYAEPEKRNEILDNFDFPKNNIERKRVK